MYRRRPQGNWFFHSFIVFQFTNRTIVSLLAGLAVSVKKSDFRINISFLIGLYTIDISSRNNEYITGPIKTDCHTIHKMNLTTWLLDYLRIFTWTWLCIVFHPSRSNCIWFSSLELVSIFGHSPTRLCISLPTVLSFFSLSLPVFHPLQFSLITKSSKV